MMNLLERITHYQKVWEIAAPHIPPPQPEDAVRWSQYPVDLVESAIIQTAKRFCRDKINDGFSSTEAFRYTTATSRKMMERRTSLIPTPEHSVPTHKETQQ